MLPILFQSPELTLYSYPLFMGLGWGIAYQIYMSFIPETVPRRWPLILFWGSFLFAWLGAKLLFFFTVPEQISQEILMSSSFWLGGGFVFYGGFLGVLAFLLLYRSFQAPVELRLLYPMLPALAFGHGIGRLGCLLAGCCYGAITEWWWGVPHGDVHRHPTQLIEALGLFFIGTFLLRSKKPQRTLVAYYFLSYSVLRFIIELLRGDEIRGQWGPLTPSAWISLVLATAGIAVLQWSKRFKPLADTEQ